MSSPDRRRIYDARPTLLLRREVGDPGRIGGPLFHRQENAVRVTVLVPTLPIADYPLKADFVQQLTDLRQGPQAPIVAEGPIHAGAVWKGEVDVADQAARDGVVFFLLPEVGEVAVVAPDGPFFGDGPVGIITAVGVEEEYPVIPQGPEHAREVAFHRVAFLEQPIAEVHGRDDVRPHPLDGEDILFQQAHPLCRVLVQGREVMVPPPVQYPGVDVHAHRPIGPAASNPFTANRGGAAEVFPQQVGVAPA